MKKPIAVSIGVLVIAGAVGGALLWPAPPRKVTISFVAPPGTRVTGAYDVDGIGSQIDVEAPTEIQATGKRLNASVRKDAQPGELVVRITVEGIGYASTAAGPNGGVLAGFQSGPSKVNSASLWATNTVGDQKDPK